jgi:hypothetical protein
VLGTTVKPELLVLPAAFGRALLLPPETSELPLGPPDLLLPDPLPLLRSPAPFPLSAQAETVAAKESAKTNARFVIRMNQR